MRSAMRAFVVTMLLSGVSAGVANAQRAVDLKGVHFGVALSWMSIELDETTFTDDKRETGIGLNLNVGYNFTKNLGLNFGVNAASIVESGTGDYEVGHVELAGRYSFVGRSAFVPYLELGLTALNAEFEVQGQEVELKGGGLTGVAGFNYFFTRRAALDLNLRITGGELDDIEIDGSDAGDVDKVSVNTTRLNLGIAIYP